MQAQHHSTLNVLRSLVDPLLGFVYPPTCSVCDGPPDDSKSKVCHSCWGSIRHMTADDLLYLEMRKRLMDSPHIADLVSLFHFEKDGTLQAIVHQLKYEGMTRLGVELGRRLGERLQSERIVEQVDAIVPVPLHATKLRERGYNQSEFIAKGIRHVVDLPVYASLLRRHKYTSSQTKLNADERKENVGDAFSVNRRYLLNLEGKRFLIVDDVITTGATIDACAGALRRCGAGKVIVGSVALADHSILP